MAAAERSATVASPRVADEGGARDIVVRDIVRGLYEGRYMPGQRLQEARLTNHYGVSRGPVREALTTLAARGVVTLAPERGARIRVLLPQEAIDTLTVAQSLIALAARSAALNIERPGAADTLEAALDALIGYPPASRAPEFAMARDGFYGALTHIAANTELSRLLPTIGVHLIRVQFQPVLQIVDSRRHTDYRRIAAAVLAGRAREAQAAARLHLGRAIDALRDHLAETLGEPG